MLEQFVELVSQQWKYGGQKYAYSGQKESTDVLFDDFGKNWLFGTLAKYCRRYANLARERDLLKIACYCFILYLKRGFHLKEEGTKESINTTVDVKAKYFPVFIKEVKDEINNSLITRDNELEVIYLMLKDFGNKPFNKILKEEIYEIFSLCYYKWICDIDNKGKDQDVYLKTDKKGDN